MAALPLSWAVRQELQDKSYREIALYFQQLVGLGGVQRIALVSREGSVRVASDKKLEGRTATEAFPGAPLEDDRPAVRPVGAKGLEAVVPIMGLNTRLGTLIIDYDPAKADPRPTPAPPPGIESLNTTAARESTSVHHARSPCGMHDEEAFRAHPTAANAEHHARIISARTHLINRQNEHGVANTIGERERMAPSLRTGGPTTTCLRDEASAKPVSHRKRRRRVMMALALIGLVAICVAVRGRSERARMILLRHLRTRFGEELDRPSRDALRCAVSAGLEIRHASRSRLVGRPSASVDSPIASRRAGDSATACNRDASCIPTAGRFLTIVGRRVRFFNVMARWIDSTGARMSTSGQRSVKERARSFNRFCTGPERAENRHRPIQSA